MIIELFLQLIFNIFSLLTTPISIPRIPQTAIDYITINFGYITDGISFLGNFVLLDVVLALLGIIVAIDIGLGIYYLVMWILKKIPMAGIS